jgi:death-on-curing protein
MHVELIAAHGGLAGPPRLADLEAALTRPEQQYRYATQPLPLEQLAAAYGFALERNHCFPDGNKRVALAVIEVFLQLNERELLAEEVDAANTMQRVASGEMTEGELAAWIAAHT